ncbi:MAG: type I-E CRISPR-associated protein Cas5/CasD [Dactylosporangium sp.]|nr:type I-E CRISPR-associated protein Cas5/CasD [Dactylosporangium sp.]NNJ63449.1 type I-E CRISPR-associated protein Cas5/CasD [Dactylosporangium sp.]
MTAAPDTGYSLVLRLAAPVQSWGGHSEFNRRDTQVEPTKGGVLGLLAAAQGRRRADPIEDLLGLRLAVRTDRPGTLLRDYHTASDHRQRPLPSAQVTAKGTQKPTSPAKYTYVTQRFYLQDAVFLAAVGGPVPLLTALAEALRRPAFPLALGRRSCPPTQPLLLAAARDQAEHAAGLDPALWVESAEHVLCHIAWQASETARATVRREATRQRRPVPTTIDLPITADAPPDVGPGEHGTAYDVRADVPRSFDPLHRGFTSRRVQQLWARDIPTGLIDERSDTAATVAGDTAAHDPFALLGW